MGLFNADYEKEGRGVSKYEKPRNGFVRFFQTLWQRLFQLVLLNILYLFACLPIVTIGPATAAMNYIVRNYATGRPVDFWQDFIGKCKEHFKQGIAVFLIDVVVGVILYLSVNMWSSDMMNLPEVLRVAALIFCFWVLYILVCSNLYIFPMMACFDLPLKKLIKNSVILSMAKLGRNLGMIAIYAIAFLLMWLLFPLSVPLALLLSCTALALATNFIVYPVFEKHIAIPKEETEDVEEAVFRDNH